MRGYIGINCERRATMRDRHLVVHASPVTSTSINVMWEFPLDRTTSFKITYRASSDPQMYMSQSETVQPGTRSYTIQRLQPETKYNICVQVIIEDQHMTDKKCTDSITLANDEMGRPKPRPPPPNKPVDKKTYQDNKQSNFHKYGMLVFGIAIAICAVAIVIVTVLYRKRLQASRDTSSTPAAIQTTSTSDMNDNNMRLAVVMPNEVPTICITDASEMQTQPSSPLAPTAPPNTPTLPSYEEAVSVMSGHSVPFPQINPSQTTSNGHHQIAGNNSSGVGGESNL
ncbi:uncharacterized protein [Amphiura filiformis]|uniref:uncharacterized protein n=1 Tax=Amphiura filiformis TaxID=82378 RepID=UPI003B21C1FC